MLRIGDYVVPSIAEEGLIEIRSDQPSKDQFKYLSVATEGINNPETRVKMVSKLYEDLMKHGNIDFGPIPACRGDLTKYKYHKDIVENIKRLESLLGNSYCGEFELTQKLSCYDSYQSITRYSYYHSNDTCYITCHQYYQKYLNRMSKYTL